MIIEEPHAENVRQYLRTMNLYGELRGRQLDLFVEPTEPQHLPVSPLRTSDETESIAAKLRGILLRKIPSHPENPVIGSALGIALAELLENFKRHSESRGFAFVCAQYYPAHEYRDTGAHRRVRRDLIELAVADTGVGIEKSLSSVPECAQAIQRGTNPCELATRFGITSKPVGHGGYGLWVTKRLAERNRGAFKIASGRHYFSSGAGTPRAGSVPTEWPGTLVAMRLNSREDLDVRSVYDELPALESS